MPSNGITSSWWGPSVEPGWWAVVRDLLAGCQSNIPPGPGPDPERLGPGREDGAVAGPRRLLLGQPDLLRQDAGAEVLREAGQALPPDVPGKPLVGGDVPQVRR